jgi:COX assembly protein 1
MGWACREQKLIMNSCLLSYQGPDEMDKARAQWFKEAGERKRAKEEKARKAEEAMKKHREYWGIEERERLLREKNAKEQR